MQIPIINGIYTDANADFRTAYPHNLIPVPKQNGISQGYLRPADGLEVVATVGGIDRGGINWSGTCYRVCGSNLIRVDANNNTTILGSVENDDMPVSMAYSFDRLAIVSNRKLFYYSNGVMSQVTDSDLGSVIGVTWIDGYFLLTDGTSMIVTDLSDPYSVNPLKYGSAEADPDPIMAVEKFRGELYAIGRYTIEAFQDVGNSLFPFQRIPGALITRGAIGRKAACVFMDTFAFVGSRRNEPLAVWSGMNGSTVKLSTREIDQILQGYSEYDLISCVVEAKIEDNHQFLYVHLPDKTLVYDAAGSAAVQEPVWFTLGSGNDEDKTYRARFMVWCDNRWTFGDPTKAQIGTFTNKVSSHYGEVVGWEFGTQIVYNEGKGALIHELELVTLSGRVEFGADPVVWTSYSTDGTTWSQEHPKRAGKTGERNIRLSWLQQGNFRQWRIQKFRGTSEAFLSFAKLEARMEALNV